MSLQSQLQELQLPESFFHYAAKYKEHLLKWNKIHNLTGAKDEQTLDDFISDDFLNSNLLNTSTNFLFAI